ncbi:hypothetical protein VHUM_03733 [Vanrija humicola]|uniref:Anaphase-promoting complex subunit 4-like WD40 domain-containing protein n=1 Tax=Vanrija humicola TaxID=5417 RepID=A0A7D8UZC2_VANHU|nr:hypothetical protein VHUM_03733 [Vanrija humicola]
MELTQPPPDSVSKISFSPTQDILAVASWDNHVRLYSVASNGQSDAKAAYNHEAPVLDLAWTKNGSHLFSSGCDNAAFMYDLTTGQKQQVAAHDAPIKCVECVETNGTTVLITAGFDKQLRYWDTRQPTPIQSLALSDRAYAMDATDKIAVVGTADRQIHIYDLNNPFQTYRNVESPLKWQTRVISCFPASVGGDGYAVGSIEGRVGIQYAHQVDEKKNFSFKCHRTEIPPGSMGAPAVNGSQNVFAINTITFHKIQGTFCTGGGDGSLTFWDGMARTKLKAFSAKELGNGDPDARPTPQWGVPIVSSSFNHSCEILAYAFSYDWSKGHQGVPPSGSNPTKIMLHSVKAEEVNRKKK